MQGLFTTAIPIWNIALRTFIVYVVLLVLLRLAGKREIGQMTAFDIVVILTVANAVQNAMVGPDNSLIGGLVAAAVLIGVNYGVSMLGLRSLLFRNAVRGQSTILVNRGQYLMHNLQREGLTPEDVLMAVREHEIDSIDRVKLAILETDGSISIVPDESKTLRTRPKARPPQMKLFRKRG